MVRFFQPTPDDLADLTGEGKSRWREVRRIWRGDAIRRRHEQLFELRHAHILGQCDLWIAWDDTPHDHNEWFGPHHCLAIVVVVGAGRSILVQFAAGRDLHSWVPLAVRQIEAHYPGKAITLYCRKGWKQEFAHCWHVPVTVERDPGLLCVHPVHSLTASA